MFTYDNAIWEKIAGHLSAKDLYALARCNRQLGQVAIKELNIGNRGAYPLHGNIPHLQRKDKDLSAYPNLFFFGVFNFPNPEDRPVEMFYRFHHNEKISLFYREFFSEQAPSPYIEIPMPRVLFLSEIEIINNIIMGRCIGADMRCYFFKYNIHEKTLQNINLYGKLTTNVKFPLPVAREKSHTIFNENLIITCKMVPNKELCYLNIHDHSGNSLQLPYLEILHSTCINIHPNCNHLFIATSHLGCHQIKIYNLDALVKKSCSSLSDCELKFTFNNSSPIKVLVLNKSYIVLVDAERNMKFLHPTGKLARQAPIDISFDPCNKSKLDRYSFQKIIVSPIGEVIAEWLHTKQLTCWRVLS
jgi:hypothetical protein